GAGGPDFAQPRRAKATVPPGSETATGGYRVAGKLPPVLGGQLRALGRPAGRDENQGNKTKMTNTGTLKVTTPTDREIVLTRVFDAPRNLVFDAFSKPELLKRWFGPRGWSLVVCEVDLRVGGGFRFVLRGPDGRDMGMRGVYREIVPPERSVHMESFDDY